MISNPDRYTIIIVYIQHIIVHESYQLRLYPLGIPSGNKRDEFIDSHSFDPFDTDCFVIWLYWAMEGDLNKYDINYPVCLGFLHGDLNCITARL